jgi:ferritin
MDLLDKLKIAGGEKASSDALYSLDRDLGKTADGAISAQDVTADNP